MGFSNTIVPRVLGQAAPATVPVRERQPRHVLAGSRLLVLARDAHPPRDLAIALPVGLLGGDQRIIHGRLDVPLGVDGP